MTEVAFHFNVPKPTDYLCRLLRKAVGSGARLVVTGPADALERLDDALWAFSATDFVPHCGLDADPATLASTPIVFAGSIAQVPHREVLINLGATVPDGFDQFNRVIEVVGPGESDRLSGRIRWKQYADHGHSITRHDLGAQRPA